MKQFHSARAIFLAAGLAMAVFPIPHAMAQENQCPAYSHPTVQTGDVVHCKCNDQFVPYSGRCQLKAAVEDQLNLKIHNALQGIKYTTDAIRAERTGLISTVFYDDFELIDLAAGSALLIENPLPLASAATKLSYDLGATLSKWNNCTAMPSLQAECDNLNNFKRIVNDTGTELYNVQRQ